MTGVGEGAPDGLGRWGAETDAWPDVDAEITKRREFHSRDRPSVLKPRTAPPWAQGVKPAVTGMRDQPRGRPACHREARGEGGEAPGPGGSGPLRGSGLPAYCHVPLSRAAKEDTT